MKPYGAALFLISVSSWVVTGPASAAEPACLRESFVEARTLSELPASVLSILGSGHLGTDGIADRDGMFNATDIVVPFLPTRRFVLAAVGERCVVIALEQGGVGHMFTVLLLKRAESTWETSHQHFMPTPPGSLQELVTYVSR